MGVRETGGIALDECRVMRIRLQVSRSAELLGSERCKSIHRRVNKTFMVSSKFMASIGEVLIEHLDVNCNDPLSFAGRRSREDEVLHLFPPKDKDVQE